jgi:hypothetical protein
MYYLLLFAGIFLLIFITTDFLATVFLQKGAGYLTRTITSFVAGIFKLLSRNNGENKILEYKVLVIIVMMILSWLFFTWLGVTMIFSSDPSSIVKSPSGDPTTFFEKMYFAGYTLSTMGLGDYMPNGTRWQLFTTMASASGFVILTISITYIVPVINNITEKKILSLRITSLGKSVYEILKIGYDGESFKPLDNPFFSLAEMILRFTKNHAAYPILHHLHTVNKDENAVIKLALLNEVCFVLLHHIPVQKQVSQLALAQVNNALEVFTASVRNKNLSEEPPPQPDIDRLEKQLGFEFIRAHADDPVENSQAAKRRIFFKGLLEDDGFTWEEVQ